MHIVFVAFVVFEICTKIHERCFLNFSRNQIGRFPTRHKKIMHQSLFLAKMQKNPLCMTAILKTGLSAEEKGSTKEIPRIFLKKKCTMGARSNLSRYFLPQPSLFFKLIIFVTNCNLNICQHNNRNFFFSFEMQ